MIFERSAWDNAPSIYDEKKTDWFLGYYDLIYPNEKRKYVDSIYATGRIQYSENI